MARRKTGKGTLLLAKKGREGLESTMRSIPGKANQVIQQLIAQTLSAGRLTRREHLLLTSTLLSASRMTDEERRQINRILDEARTGRLKLVD